MMDMPDMSKMSPNEMSSKMKAYMHSPAMEKKMMRNFGSSWCCNTILAGIFGWFAFPSGNLDN